MNRDPIGVISKRRKYDKKICRPINGMAVTQQKRDCLFCCWSYRWRNYILGMYGISERKYTCDVCTDQERISL